jgi:hypothetical protein
MIIEPFPGMSFEQDAPHRFAGVQPWDARYGAVIQSPEFSAFLLTDAPTISGIAEDEAWKLQKATEEAANDAEILRITGQTRDVVMASAKIALHDARGYWPHFAERGDAIEVRNTDDQKIVWEIGDTAWRAPISTRGTCADSGAGYGMNI